MDRGRSSYRGRRSRDRDRERRPEYHPRRSPTTDFYGRPGHQGGDQDRSRPSYYQGGRLRRYDDRPRSQRGGLRRYDDRPRSQRPYDHDSYGRRHERRSHDTDFASHDRYRRDPQQCTTQEEDESVTIILMDIYSELRVEVIRASVNHPENHRRPFDKGILLQRCLEDLRGLSTWRRTSRPGPSAALGAPPQEPSTSEAPTASTASVSAPKPSTSGTQRIDKSDTSSSDKQRSREKTSGESQSSLQRPRESTSGVSQSTPSRARENIPSSAQESKKIDDKTQKSSGETTEQKSSMKRKQEWVKVTYKKTVKQAKYVTSYAYRKDIRKGRPSRESEPVEPSKKRRRVTPKMKCFMTGCDAMNKHMKKHVIGKHLPTEAYSKTGDLPLGARMRILEDLLNKIAHHLGCEDLKALLQKVLSLKFYPTTDKTYEVTEPDIEMMNQFHHWLYSENLPRTPSISPPNLVASLVQWRALAHLINCIGESKFNVKCVKIDKVRVTRDIVPASVDNSDVQVELTSDQTDQAKSKEKSSEKQTHKKSVKQNLDKANTAESAPKFRPLSVVAESLKQASVGKVPQGKASSEKKAKEVESSEFVVVDSLSPDRGDEMEIDREEVISEREERQEEITESVGSEEMETNKPVETKESTSSATRSYAAVVKSSPAVPSQVKKVKPMPLGIPYPQEERELRLVRLVRNSQRIPFVDSHFHLDRVQQQSRMEDLEEILANGPIPQTPMKLEAAIANFIDGVPSRNVRQALSKDRRGPRWPSG